MKPQTFDVRSCRDLRDKLERELERLRRATSHEDVIDHGMNFVLTAWHLVDWTWAGMKHTPELRSRLACDEKKDFQRFMFERCPDLRYCQIVATASKHLQCNHHPDNPDFDPLVAPGEIKWVNKQGEEFWWTNNKSEKITFTSNAWDLWIVERNSRRRAAEVFEAVLRCWTQFINNFL